MIDWNTIEKCVAILAITLLIIFAPALSGEAYVMTGIAAIAGLAGGGIAGGLLKRG